MPTSKRKQQPKNARQKKKQRTPQDPPNDSVPTTPTEEPSDSAHRVSLIQSTAPLMPTEYSEALAQHTTATIETTYPAPVMEVEHEVHLGAVGPLLHGILSFISTASKAHKSLSAPTPSFVAAKPALASFRLWAISFDSEECPLDDLLAEDHFLKETVVLLLSGFLSIAVKEFGFLCDEGTIQDLKTVLQQICPGSSDSSTISDEETTVSSDENIVLKTGSDASDNSSVPEGETMDSSDCDNQTTFATFELEATVQALFDLSTGLEEMSERIKTRESRLAALNEAFARNPAEPWLAYYFGRIRDKYPRAEQWVIDITIKGAIDCYSRLFPMSYLEPSIPREHSLAESTAHLERAFSVALSVTSEAVTMADNTRGYFFPSAPKVDPTIGCFICPVCKKWQMVREWMNKDEVDSAWMKHICADIEPYMCLNETCAQHARSFKRLRDLMEHHRIEHGGTRPPPDCPFGCPDDGGFPDDIDWYKHVGHHMRDVRLMVLPTSLYESRKYDDTTFDSESVNSSSLGVSHVGILHIDEMQEDPSKAEGMAKFISQAETFSGDQLRRWWMLTIENEDSKLNAEKSKQNFAAQQNRPGSSILATTTVTSHDEHNLPAHLNLNN